MKLDKADVAGKEFALHKPAVFCRIAYIYIYIYIYMHIYVCIYTYICM
jgi:hypothetical protein